MTLSRRQFLAAGLGAAGTLATGVGLGAHVLPLLAREDLIPGQAPDIALDPAAWTTTADHVSFVALGDNGSGGRQAMAVAEQMAKTYRARPYGNVASAGLAASHDLAATVMPFIIRGVSLLGVASAGTARDIRDEVWRRLASDWKPRHLERIRTREVGLDGLPAVFDAMLAGGSLGRTLVRL